MIVFCCVLPASNKARDDDDDDDDEFQPSPVQNIFVFKLDLGYSAH